MKKSLLAAMAAAALLATTAYAATPQTNVQLAGKDAVAVSKAIVINPGGSDGMTAKSADQFNATNFGAATGKYVGLNVDKSSLGTQFTEKTSLAALGMAENGAPPEKVLVSADKAVLLGKKPEVIVNAPAPNMPTNDVAILVDPPKNGSSEKVTGTGAQFTIKIVQRATIPASFTTA